MGTRSRTHDSVEGQFFLSSLGGDGGQICYRRIQLSSALLLTLTRLLFRVPLVGLLDASFASKRQKPTKRVGTRSCFFKSSCFWVVKFENTLDPAFGF